MTRLLLALTACMALPGICLGADRLYLSRTLQLDFRPPGRIVRLDASGAVPVSEETRLNSFIVILPKRIALTVSIGRDNEEGRRNLIGLKVQDELAPVQKTQAWMIPTDLTKMLWLDAYRYQVTMVRKEFDERGFVAATIRIEVYAPEAKKAP